MYGYLSLCLAISNFGPIGFSPFGTRTAPLAFVGMAVVKIHRVDTTRRYRAVTRVARRALEQRWRTERSPGMSLWARQRATVDRINAVGVPAFQGLPIVVRQI